MTDENELRKTQSTSSLRNRSNTTPLNNRKINIDNIATTNSNNNNSNNNIRKSSLGNNKPMHIPTLPMFKEKEKLRKRLSISSLPSPMHTHAKKLSLWNYLLLEIHSSTDTTFTEEKTEQLINMIKVPMELEKVILFGTLACLDSFLYTFTILPIRFVSALYKLFSTSGRNVLSPSKRGDVTKGVLFFIILTFLLRIDTSKIYHGIRGQAAIKLYMMFNVLEIGDKLCSAIGQDIMECLYSSNTVNRPLRFLLFALMAIIYSFVHSFVLLYQVITLNVAVNSYSNALLTLLLSNQFSEIKSAVFKKFERENLFQLTGADITERFQLLAMLLSIGIRNVVEVSNIGIVPLSWAGWNRWFGALFRPAFVVVGSEVLVDWLKHAYICKFNNIRPRVYRKFLDVLSLDYAENAFSDQIMTKRTGLPVYPLAAVFVRMLIQSYTIFAQSSATMNSSPTSLTSAASPSARSALEKVDDYLRQNISTNAIFSMNFIFIGFVTFCILLTTKLVIGSWLYKYSTERYQHLRMIKENNNEQSDFVPALEKGFGTVELDGKMRTRMYEPEEDVPIFKDKKGNKESTMWDYWSVSRFKMVAKRIW